MKSSTRFSWTMAPDLMDRLTRAQNRHTSQDIMTFAGMCGSRAELERHVIRYEQMTGLNVVPFKVA